MSDPESAEARRGPKRRDPVDAHVGNRVKIRRKMLGMSQKELGDHLDLTFQQIQKCEKGQSRIGAGRLWRISEILDVPVSFFFDGIDDDRSVTGHEPLDTKALGVASKLSQLEDDRLRQSVVGMLNEIVRVAKEEMAEEDDESQAG